MVTQRTVDQILNLLEPNTIVQHFKRQMPHTEPMFGLYKIIGVAKTEENPKDHVVVYQSLLNRQIWTRPVQEFISETPKKYVTTFNQKYRFEIFTGSEQEVAEITTLLSQNITYPSKVGECYGSQEKKN